MGDKSFKQVIEEIMAVEKRFNKIEGKPWGAEGAVIELMKQVGELSSLVMMHEKYYFSNREKINPKYAAGITRIGDELADILFAIIRIADHYGIDLIKSNEDARKEEIDFLKKKGV
jgi:NTP pyrophosphatase (non-canonical NTP hydrolase)